MKLRLAKKILTGKNKHRLKRFPELRPPYIREDGVMVFPSWHDIEIVSRANTRLRKWFKNGKKK